MFVKKFVEKAAKKPGGSLEAVRANDVEPRVVFHYGIPSGSLLFAYDQIQNILAVSTKDGRIKLFGKDHSQALLVSEETSSSSKFLEFIQNQGILLNVNAKNQIEVWDIDKKHMSHVHDFNCEITSLGVLQQTPYFYVGDSSGNLSVLKIDQESGRAIPMNYTIPYVASNGYPVEAPGEAAMVAILPQPTAETKRILLVFANGVIVLWDIKESKPILKTGSGQQGIQTMQHQDVKKPTCACWVCPNGSKIAIGYNNGEIQIWNIHSKDESLSSESEFQASIICKLNLAYKSEKVPIASLQWVYADGKASRLYVTGSSSKLLQVVLLNEMSETRTVKIGLHASEPCADMAIIPDTSEHSKHKQEYLLVLGKSGRVYAYDDLMIEKYLLQSPQSKSPSLPKEIGVKIPFAESLITSAKLLTNPSHILNPSDEDYIHMAKDVAPFLPSQTGSRSVSSNFPGFSKVKNVLITGHNDGALSIWDMSCPFLIPVLTLKEQTEYSVSRVTAITALHYDSNARILSSGDQNGMVHMYRLKPEPYATENGFIPFQGNMKKGNNHIIQSVKHIKLNGSITCLQKSQSSRHLAVGSDQGHVSLIDVEGATVLYQKHIGSDICPGVISLQFEICNVQGFEKNVIVVAMRDSSVFAIDRDMGNMIGANVIKPNQPSKALFMQILDGSNETLANELNTSRDSPVEEIRAKQPSVLMCSEKASYVYSLPHLVQGVKKVLTKKKYGSSTCCSASTFNGASGVGLVVVLTDGTVEIRSLPDLSMVKRTSIRGFTYPPPQLNSLPETTISASSDGDLLIVNGDQELIVTSVLPYKDIFGLLDTVSQVYRKGIEASREEMVAVAAAPKEKKGIFGSVFRGSKPKKTLETEPEDVKDSVEDMTYIFSTANFPWNVDKAENTSGRKDGDTELDIDDIDLEDHREQPKEQHGILSGLNKQNLTSKFNSIKGMAGKLKMKQMTVKKEKSVSHEEKASPVDQYKEEKGNSLDEIKKKYGFASSGEMGAAKMAQSKLQDNLRKLQGISLKTTEMEDTAKSFSSTAKELLNAVEYNKHSSKP